MLRRHVCACDSRLFVLLLPRCLSSLSPLAYPLQYLLSVLVQLHFRDHNLAWVYADRYALSIGLLPRDSFDVNEVFETVDRCDFAFSAFVGAAYNEDFVVFSDWNATDLRRSCQYHGCIIPIESYTLCFSRSSLFRGELMIVLRPVEPALKWAFRDFLLEEARPSHKSIKCSFLFLATTTDHCSLSSWR